MRLFNPIRRNRTIKELEVDIAEATVDRLAQVVHHYIFALDPERAYTVTVGLYRAARQLSDAQMARQVEQVRDRRAA